MGDIRDSFEQERNNAKAAVGTLNASLVARAFEVMLPKHNGTLILKHNPHLNTNMRTFMRHAGKLLFFTSATEQQKCEATNEMWVLHYTSEENAHLRLAAATLPAIARWLEDNGLAFGS